MMRDKGMMKRSQVREQGEVGSWQRDKDISHVCVSVRTRKDPAYKDAFRTDGERRRRR